MGFEFSPAGHLGSFRAALTERVGGVSPHPYNSLNLGRSTPDAPGRVEANEARVLTALGLHDRVARLRLEHGRRVLRVEESGLHGPADALLTDRDELVLWLTVADCHPLVLTVGSYRALGHCGWRGVDAGLVETLLAELSVAAGTRASQVRAWIGPGIGVCCYPVGPEVAGRFPDSITAEQPPRLDLKGEICRRLAAAGLPLERVAASSACTSCARDRFFSHRRDGFPSGRMAALCWSPSSSAR